ncbi:MAG: YcxB family protein [Luteolibacter sp.]
MEIQYQNTREDFKVFYQILWSSQKVSRRSQYYYSVFWYLAVLGLGIYFSAKHEEVFGVCVFVALAGLYVRQNWSFAKQWNASLEAYADMNRENLLDLVLDESGATERFSGIQLHVPWSEIRDYTVDQERLFIHFLKHRSFIIPFCYLSAKQRDELIETLERHKVQKKA